ncbi:MAG: NAD(P)/FAD-dependent oxidoreductase [Lachnospiraceae bacterium]|nr:NAD(P)/FAD-dependent oxidoreductase [Lachnospiraceae bacterium]
MSYDVLVIGGGASGMMAAIAAKKSGAKVGILEKNPLLGKKILATGNGRCNFTNEFQDESCYRSGNPILSKEVLEGFNVELTLMEFSKIGILAKSKDGYYYPRSNQAVSVRHCFEKAILSNDIDFFPNSDVVKIQTKEDGFLIETKETSYEGKKLILCTGGKASPKSGSDGSGYKFAKGMGHHIIKPLPALVQLHCKENYFKKLKGIRSTGKVSLQIDGEKVAFDTGEIQFTKDGISGIPVFNISRYAVRALDQKKDVVCSIDLFPDFTYDVLCSHLRNQLIYRSYPVTILDGMMGMLNDQLIPVLLKIMGLNALDSTTVLDEQMILDMASFLKDWQVVIVGNHDFEFAQVTSGGIDLNEVNPTMESKLQKGLFFAGEVLDLDGICGGYNLQWAWSSGYIAGKNAAEH